MKLIYNETTLPNGVRIVTSEMPHIQSVAMGIWAGVGGRYESRRNSGLSHFIEHLLFKGTRKRNAREISEAIEGRGGYFNAFTQEESTCYYARITTDYMEDVLEILSDMYLRPRFDPDEVDRERGVIVEEIMMYRDQPHQHVQDMLGELLWSRHALGRPLIGTPERIRKVPRADIIDFKNKKYVPKNTVISMAGRLEHDACVKLVASMFRWFKHRTPPKHFTVDHKTRQEPLGVCARPIEQTHLAMGIRLFGRRDPRRFALKILSVLLGENMSSRLFQVIRERHGLAYSIHSSVHLYEETGTLMISAGMDSENTPRTMGLIMKELVRLKNKKVSPKELQRAKDYAVGQLSIGLESSVNQMMWLGENILGYGSFSQPEIIVRRLNRVTADEIQRLAQTVFKPRRISMALISPEDTEKQRVMLNRVIESVG